MTCKLCASHLTQGLSFGEMLNKETGFKARGFEVYGPVRTIEADSEEEAEDAFLDLYRDDFNAIKCVDTGYVHIVEA